MLTLPILDKRKFFKTAKLNGYFVGIKARKIQYINNKPIWFFLVDTGVKSEYIPESKFTDFCL